MIIAKKGNYILQHRTFLGRQKLTTLSVEICKKCEDNSIITICTLDKDTHNLISCGNRLLSTMQTVEDLEDIKKLVEILYSIYDTEEIILEQERR